MEHYLATVIHGILQQIPVARNDFPLTYFSSILRALRMFRIAFPGLAPSVQDALHIRQASTIQLSCTNPTTVTPPPNKVSPDMDTRGLLMTHLVMKMAAMRT